MPQGSLSSSTPLCPDGAKQRRHEALATLLGKHNTTAETGAGAKAVSIDGADQAIVVHLDEAIQSGKQNCWSWLMHRAPKGVAFTVTGAQTAYAYWILNGGHTAPVQSVMGASINSVLMADEVGAEIYDAPTTWSAFQAQDGWGKAASIAAFTVGSHLAAGAAVIVYQPYQMMLKDQLHLPITPARALAGQAMLATQWAFLVPSSARGVYGLGAAIERSCNETPSARQRRCDVNAVLNGIEFTLTTGSDGDKQQLLGELADVFADGTEKPWDTITTAAVAAHQRPAYWLGWVTAPIALCAIVGLPTLTQANDIAVGIAPDKFGNVSMPVWGYGLGPALLAARYGHPDIATGMSIALNLGNGFMDYRLVERNLRYGLGILTTMLTNRGDYCTTAKMLLSLTFAGVLCGLTVAGIANQTSLASGADSICFGNQTCPLTDGYKDFITSSGVADYSTEVSKVLGGLFNYLALFRFAMWGLSACQTSALDEGLSVVSGRIKALQAGTATVFTLEEVGVAETGFDGSTLE